MSRDLLKRKHLLRHRESKKLSRAASTSYFPVHLFIWTLWNTSAQDKMPLGFLLQQISYLLLLFRVLSTISCSWLGPETVAHRLDSSPVHPSCLATYVYIQCFWYLAVRSAASQILKPKLKEWIWELSSNQHVRSLPSGEYLGTSTWSSMWTDQTGQSRDFTNNTWESDKDDGQAIGCPTIKTHPHSDNAILDFDCIVRQDLC